MSSVRIYGDTSGSITLSAPTSGTDVTITLPSTTGTIALTSNSSFTGQTSFASGASASPSLTFSDDTDTGMWSPTADTVAFSTGGSERIRITSAGDIYKGHTESSGTTSSGVTPSTQISGTSHNTSALGIYNFSNANIGPAIRTFKSRSATVGNTAVLSGDVLAYFEGRGADGTTYVVGAGMAFVADGAASSNNVPGRISFSTNGGASSATERMRIDSAGQVTVGLGSAAAPVLSFSGDTNTGVYSPAADNVSLSTGGTERLRVDSNGNTFGVAAQNLLYNGAMQVAQRGTSTTGITTFGYYTADRWNLNLSSLGTWTQTVETDAPTGSGFRRSLKMLCTTADSSPASGDYLQFEQKLEGFDLQRIAKGTSSAKQLTLSFWVKSNVTGTYAVRLLDADNSNRMTSKTYTISASATWEYKTLVFAADTTGVLDNDNAVSLIVSYFLGAGTSFTSGVAQDWGSYVQGNEAPGQVNVAAATNNYWQVTGVQLEVGPIASPFQFKPYQQELQECQRYYYRQNAASSAYAHFGMGMAFSTTSVIADVRLPVTMRVEPTSVESANLRVEDTNNSFALTSLTLNSNHSNESVATVDAGVASGLTQVRPYFLGANNNTDAYIGFSAEL